MWNIPNMLTVFRIFLVPLLGVVLLTEVPDKEYWGLGIFLLAALTDALDGIIARRTRTSGWTRWSPWRAGTSPG